MHTLRRFSLTNPTPLDLLWPQKGPSCPEHPLTKWNTFDKVDDVFHQPTDAFPCLRVPKGKKWKSTAQVDGTSCKSHSSQPAPSAVAKWEAEDPLKNPHPMLPGQRASFPGEELVRARNCDANSVPDFFLSFFFSFGWQK